MMVTGESFSFQKKEKSLRVEIPKVSKLSGKRTVAGQNSGELFIKSTEGAIPNL